MEENNDIATQAEDTNKVTKHVDDFNIDIPAGDGIRYWLQEKHYDGRDMGTGVGATPADINEKMRLKNYPNGPIIEIQVRENRIIKYRYTPIDTFKLNKLGQKIAKDRLIDVVKTENP